ncbi:phosphoglycerate dehydrogenase [Marinisporobacter balticus]|uniref:D-3-phosphoglycerate dehydrogenase n=1 Tax=Marinisporobacter balticus TaxID=2018667 RepID=A0A4R2KWJ5_9FIRM|nr:phosphoglycerate dehydrogenase [Marinisporobacter balticus]TCO71065.1 D-3-phosphoglycerate dehydrogenase [Marinisporobacter balticus]
MGKRKKVIITERIDEEGIKLLQKHLDVDVCLDISREELLKRIHEYDAIIVRSATKVNKELISFAEKLKVVGRAGNGTDNIDLPEATKRGIIVANTPDSNTMSAAELAIGLLMAQSRNIPQANGYIKSGKWERNRFKGVELYNKTLGIIGLGRIGSLVATRMNAFGMKVIAYDPYISDERFKRFNVEKKSTLKELIEESDFITVHTPKTKETYGMIGEKEIAWMKPGIRLVNDARGGIINEKALLKGIQSGKIASAGLDVHEEEPSINNPLFELDNVIVTPHIGASTIEAQINVGVTASEQVINALNGEIVPNAVNLPTMHRDELAAMKPYIELMEKLGKIYYQLYQNPIEHVSIEYWGSIGKQDTEMSTIAFVKGLLEPVVEDKVNYINAMILAEQRGMGVEQRKMKENYDGYTDYIEIKIKTKEGTFKIGGNLSSKREGRLMNIEGYEVDVNPSKHMLFIKNMDVPGVIGHIGMVLGEEKINVATMQVGRNAIGEKALMVLTIDDAVSNKSLEKVMKKENVLSAKYVKL